ncbi:MAG: AEC family transporter [Lachnospiraceae bacterium]|nr:AEC family transporter [Lachnospiraceae bacterium]
MILLKQMVILFLLMITGFVSRKKGILSDSDCSGLSRLVINVANPALVLTAGINQTDTLKGTSLLTAAALSVGVYVFLIISSFLMSFIIRAPKEKSNTYCVMTVFSNIGFMGFPVVSAVYGLKALLYASFFMIPCNVLLYTWAIGALGGSAGGKGITAVLKKIFNAGVVSCIFAVILYLSHIQVPVFIETFVKYIANLTAPLSMLVIGASIVKMDVKKLFGDVRLIIFCLLKLLVWPVIGIVLVKLCGIKDPMLLGVALVMLATPVGAMTAMLAGEYGGDYELASRGVALSTIMSVATMPLLSMILGI